MVIRDCVIENNVKYDLSVIYTQTSNSEFSSLFATPRHMFKFHATHSHAYNKMTMDISSSVQYIHFKNSG